MAEVASPPPVCGVVRTVGSAPRFQTVITSSDGTSTLVGALADELAGYPGAVCVEGPREGPVPGSGMVITVTSYRLVGDGKHAPIVGTIGKHGNSFFIHTRDGRRLRLVANDSTTLASSTNRLVWLTANWSDGALQLIRIGPLGH